MHLSLFRYLRSFGLALRFILFTCFMGQSAWVKAVYFEYTPELQECQRHMASLRLKQASLLIASEISKHPDNVAAHYMLEYAAFFKIMVHQDEKQFDAYQKVFESTMAKVKQLPETSPYRHFLAGSLLMQNAFVKGAFNNYLSAAWDFRSAYQEVSLNEKMFPSFLGHKKELGALVALIGTFPAQYSWIVHAVGLEGDFDKGLKILSDYIKVSANEPLIERQQAVVIHILIQLNFGKDKKKTWLATREQTKEYAQNLMMCYVRAYVAGKSGENAIALQTLKQRPQAADYEQIQYLNFLMGTYLIHELDFSASIWFKKYIANSPGKSSVKEAYQKLSWISWLQDDTLKFKIYHDLMLKNSKETGSENTLVNADMAKGIYPSHALLKSRLLFDGGYYSKAMLFLGSAKEEGLKSKFQELEWVYRLGRIYQEENKYAEAIEYYKKCLTFDTQLKSYMVPNACLNLASIYEVLNYRELAKAYYEQVLNYKGFDYESSIHQKAKAALDRID